MKVRKLKVTRGTKRGEKRKQLLEDDLSRVRVALVILLLRLTERSGVVQTKMVEGRVKMTEPGCV